MSRVPPELINHIFSFLQSDPTTLAICSRTHPYLLPIAERLLYTDIVVFDDQKKELGDNFLKNDRQNFRAAEFHKLVIDSPHIANHVRKLEICLSHHTATGIAPILPMLMQLDRIHVTAEFYDNWGCLSNKFRDAFMDRLSSPVSVLKEVSIIYFDYFPLRIFDSCPTVNHIGLHRWTTNDSDLQVLSPALDSLSLRSWQPHSLDSEFMDWARKRCRRLRFLLFHSSNQQSITEVLPELLRMCSTSLKSLELNLSDGSCFGTCFDLSSVPHLEDLTIRSNMHLWDEVLRSFPAIIQLLETTPCLNNLTLKINNMYSKIEFNRMDWSPLLTFLTHSSNKFRHIEIQLCHNVISEIGNFIPSIDTLPLLYDSEIVSNLLAKGILRICTEKWHLY